MGLDLTLTFNYEPIILIAKLAPIARKSPVMGACYIQGISRWGAIHNPGIFKRESIKPAAYRKCFGRSLWFKYNKVFCQFQQILAIIVRQTRNAKSPQADLCPWGFYGCCIRFRKLFETSTLQLLYQKPLSGNIPKGTKKCDRKWSILTACAI